METKEPYSKKGGERGLDFRGRGREPSRKNIQLQDPRDGNVAVQIVKCDEDDFHVDYAKVNHCVGAVESFNFGICV